MKKIVVILLALLWLIPVTQAVPALRGTYKYKQPDGTVIILQNHGDEYYNWTTDASGRTVEITADGFYRQVDVSGATHRARAARARAEAQSRARSWSSYDSPFSTNFGDRKVLCILAEFAPYMSSDGTTVIFDGKYTISNPRQHFSDMLNKQGYSENGAIGSVRDYYIDNSMNQYRPQFDVYGPVTLAHDPTYYDKDQHGSYHVDSAIKEAYELLKNEINIADYDTDGDGDVDMVLFYFPGHNEAEHAPSWTIWPHQSTGTFGRLGSKTFNRYFCTSELRGSEGTEPAAIGTTCHEFAHSLGLPDFYDVGEEANGGENDITDLTYKFDLMCYGNYNDDGRRPPYLTAVERNMLGWMPGREGCQTPGFYNTISSAGDYVLNGLQANEAYRIDSDKSGEFFVLECRNGSGWDSGIPNSGLVVYHVDQSNNRVSGYTTASSLWSNTNNINSYGGHPCYYIVPSSTPVEDCGQLVYPGFANIISYAPRGWSGNAVDIVLSDINFTGSQVTFRIPSEGTIIIEGFVKDVFGDPVSGATVSLIHSAYEFAAPPLIPHDQTCRTDGNGYYSFTLDSAASLEQVVTVTKDGYISQACNVSVTGQVTQQDFTMILLGQDPPATLKKYDETRTLYNTSITGVTSIATAMRYTAEELEDMGAVGATIENVSLLLGANNGESVYVIIDIGGEKSLWNITSGYIANRYITVDISDAHLVIPAGEDVYIGVGLTNLVSNTSPFRMYDMPSDNGGCFMMVDFLNDYATWQSGQIFGSPCSVAVSASLSRSAAIDFAALDISYVKLVDGLPQVVPAAGKTVKSITWTLDGTAVNGNPPAVSELSAGAHTYMARLEYYDGTAERVYYDVTKE